MYLFLPYRYGYQGDYAEQDPGTGWNSFELREYDSRIGRFTTVDPYGQFWSPYMAMGNDPVNNVDPDGGFAGPGPGFLGKLFGYKIATAANGVLGRVPGLLSGIGKFALPVISGIGKGLGSPEIASNRIALFSDKPDYGTVLQNQGPDWRTMISDVLNDPEIARFHKKAPNTVFDVSIGRPSWFKPRTEPLNGSKSKKGPARISLGPSAFESREMLFTVLGHELIHASHYETGSFARWYSKYRFNPKGKLFAHYISESFAYKWSSPYVRKYGLENRVSGYDAYHYNLKRLPKNFNFIQ